MSCDVPIPSIEDHITPPHLSKYQTFENGDYSRCPHYFMRHPFVLPESIPDHLVKFPRRRNRTARPELPRLPAAWEPSKTMLPLRKDSASPLP